MGSDNDKPARRSFGVTNRIWMVLLAIAAVLVFTHFVLLSSSDPSTSQPAYSNSHLESKNYFNVTNLGPNPFEFCPSYSDGDVLGEKYGTLTLSQSRSNLGTGARVQRLLHKALAGQPVTISIIGGSGTDLSSALELLIIQPSAHCSFGMSWCRRRPHFISVLPIQILPVVEQGLPSSSHGAHQWRHETHRFCLLWLLQLAPSPRYH